MKSESSLTILAATEGKVAAPPSTSLTGKSRRSSMWSKKLPQSISSMKLGPTIFLTIENILRKFKRGKKIRV